MEFNGSNIKLLITLHYSCFYKLYNCNRMEETYALRRSYSDVMPEEDSKSGRSRNGSIGRRSFFKRRSGRHQHQRSGSKDSRELTSFSDLSMNSDNVPIADDGAPLLYQRVEKIHCKSDCRLIMHTVQPDLICLNFLICKITVLTGHTSAGSQVSGSNAILCHQ